MVLPCCVRRHKQSITCAMCTVQNRTDCYNYNAAGQDDSDLSAYLNQNLSKMCQSFVKKRNNSCE